MKKLSADVLFYLRSIWSIIVPLFIIIFITTAPFHIPGFIILSVSVLMAVLVAYQIYYISKFRRVFYLGKTFVITNYFTQNSIEIAASNILSLVKKSRLQTGPIKNLTYKLTYSHNDKKQTVYFLKALDLYNIDNIALLLGIGTYVEVESNDYITNVNNRLTVLVKLNVESRFGSAMLDWFIMTVVAMVFSLPLMIHIFTVTSFEKPGGILWYIALIGFAAFFNKDCIYGQSIGKIIMKQQVVNNKTGQIANPLRCFVRDIFMVIWPIEGFITLFSPQRRLGDFVAGTKIILLDPELEKPEINKIQVAIAFALSYASMLLLTIFF